MLLVTMMKKIESTRIRTLVESKEQEDTEVSTKEQEEEEEEKKKDRLVVPIISAPSLRRFVMTLSLEEVTEGAFVLAMSSVESLCVDCDANANVLKLATLQLVGSLVKSSLQSLNSVSSLLDVVVKQFQTSSISSGGNVGAFTELNDALLVPSPREMKLRHAIKTLSALCSTSSMDWDKHVSNFKLSKLFDKLDGCLKSLDIISSSSLFQGKKRKIEKKSSKKKRKRSEVESLETPSSSSRSRAQKAASPASVSKPSNTLESALRHMILRFSPLVEAFFLSHTPLDLGSSSTASSGVLNAKLVAFVKEHQHLINELVRQNPELLGGALRSMVYIPCRHFLDFDNKRSFFRSRLKANAPRSGRVPPLEIIVKRERMYDTFVQLSSRSKREMRGRLQGRLRVRTVWMRVIDQRDVYLGARNFQSQLRFVHQVTR